MSDFIDDEVTEYAICIFMRLTRSMYSLTSQLKRMLSDNLAAEEQIQDDNADPPHLGKA